jgi:hypothetical protein
MVFLQPLALLLLGAALVPPLLHLFERHRPPDVVFPAVRYLRETEREAQRTIRLQHLLLMLLRVAAVALLALAAARPVVPARFGAGHEPTALVVILDHSLSSGAVSGGVRVFDDLAARAAATLRAAQPSDQLWLVGADGVARRGSREALLQALAAARPEPLRLDLSAAVATAARLVRASGYARGEIHLLSDAQRSAFAAPDSAASGLPLLVSEPAAAPPANRAVVSARAAPATWLAGSGTVAAAIGGAPAPPGGGGGGEGRVAVTVTLRGREGARALVAPRDVAQLKVTAAAPGWDAGQVSLEPDELRADDARPFAVRVVAPAVVSLDSAAAGPFVATALGALERAGQARAGSTAAVRLGAVPAAAGEAAVVFPPRDPVQLGNLNRGLAAAGVPWRFEARVEREDTLAAPLLPEIAGARVSRRWRLVAPGGVEPGGVLARAGGDPWLVRAGRTVLLGSRLVPEETSLPLAGSFVPFVGDLVNRLARGEEGILEAAPGAPVALPGAVTGLVAAGGAAHGLGAERTVAAPVEPGVTFLLAGADTVGALVVAPDPRESDLRRASDGELAALFPGARVAVTRSARAYAAERFRGAGRSELTGWLLAAALLVLALEAVVASGALERGA